MRIARTRTRGKIPSELFRNSPGSISRISINRCLHARHAIANAQACAKGPVVIFRMDNQADYRQQWRDSANYSSSSPSTSAIEDRYKVPSGFSREHPGSSGSGFLKGKRKRVDLSRPSFLFQNGRLVICRMQDKQSTISHPNLLPVR